MTTAPQRILVVSEKPSLESQDLVQALQLLDQGRSDSRPWRVYRPLMEHGRDVLSHAPGVAGEGCGVAEQVEDQHLALPDPLALKLLADGDPLAEGRAAAVFGLDGFLEGRDRLLVQWLTSGLWPLRRRRSGRARAALDREVTISAREKVAARNFKAD